MVNAQNIDIGNIGKGKAFKISGGVSANGVFYNSNQDVGREPFTHFLQGDLNINFYQFSMPMSYNYSNQGGQLQYDLPFKFNRLSLHPKYKWIQAHVGDVAMSFSPYTLDNHQFTGGGVELTPKGSFKISAMAGELLRATEDDGDELTQPAFSRFGYGAQLGYEEETYQVSIIGFYAKDDINSISAVPDDKEVTPQENIALSIGGSVQINELKIQAEYASTALTKDLRSAATEQQGSGLASLFLSNRGSTEYFTAAKVGFDYRLGESGIGVGYERIDPGYETLGAYFFNNDFENITVNSSTALFQEKLKLSLNIGLQRDDLNSQKEQTTNRTVGTINVTCNASEKLTITAMYSNFNTFTNARVNQFDDINDDNLLDNAEEQFDYKQLSQDANVGINYILTQKEHRRESLTVNYSLADVVNEQGGLTRIGDASTFHNANTSYMLDFPKRGTNITIALNGTINTIGREDVTTWGPTLNYNKKFFENKLDTNFGASYNTSSDQSDRTSVTNFKANATYIYNEKHNFKLDAIQLFSRLSSGSNQDLTLTFGYSYSF